MSPFRRARVLMALGPPAGTLGLLLGCGLGWHGGDGIGEILRDLAAGRGWNAIAFFSFFSFAATLGVAGIGRRRGRPFHAGKAAPLIGALLGIPGWWLGRLAAEIASC